MIAFLLVVAFPWTDGVGYSHLPGARADLVLPSRDRGVPVVRGAAPPRVETIGEVAVWSLAVGPDDEPAGAPAFVRASEDTLTCRRSGGSARILFLPFERAGDEAAYGIYALGSAKDDFPVPWPLRGDPVTWPGRDHKQALAYALALAGVAGERARAVVTEKGPEWFAEGLRVFFVLPVPLEPHLANLEVAAGCRALVVRVDVRR